MAGYEPARPDKTVSRAATLASTLGRSWIFRKRLIVVRCLAGADMLASDLPPDRLRYACQRGIDLCRAQNRLVVVCRDTPLPASGVIVRAHGRPRHRHADCHCPRDSPEDRSEEHTSELQSLMRISYAVFCLKKKKNKYKK